MPIHSSSKTQTKKGPQKAMERTSKQPYKAPEDRHTNSTRSETQNRTTGGQQKKTNPPRAGNTPQVRPIKEEGWSETTSPPKNRKNNHLAQGKSRTHRRDKSRIRSPYPEKTRRKEEETTRADNTPRRSAEEKASKKIPKGTAEMLSPRVQKDQTGDPARQQIKAKQDDTIRVAGAEPRHRDSL